VLCDSEYASAINPTSRGGCRPLSVRTQELWSGVGHILALALILGMSAARAENSTRNLKNSNVSVGLIQPRCQGAFDGAPVDKFGQPREDYGEPSDFEAHFDNHEAAYLRYDRDCLAGWSGENGLKQATKRFLQNDVGALFKGETPYCAAFRISEHLIVTARHCQKGIGVKEVVFKLYARPDVAIAIKRMVVPTESEYSDDDVTNDLDDFIVYETADAPAKFSWTRDIFRRNFLPDQVIFIAAVNRMVLRLLKGSWLESVRFSRTNSNRVWSFASANPTSAAALAENECVYHRAPTFEGMSGAPIFAILRNEVPHFRIIGIHLRNGFSTRTGGCGNASHYNVGIRLPTAVLNLIGTY
jgi:hypothetical protein